MAIGPQNKNIRAGYLSAAVLTVAALTLTGCGQPAAQDAPGATSNTGAKPSTSTQGEATTSTTAADSKAAAIDSSVAAAPQAPAPAAQVAHAKPVLAVAHGILLLMPHNRPGDVRVIQLPTPSPAE